VEPPTRDEWGLSRGWKLELQLTNLLSRDVGSNDWLEHFMQRMKFIKQKFALNRLKRHKML
jgi:hypothetical protein